MEEVKIPFLKKNEAISLGTIFDRNLRKWFVPDEGLGFENRILIHRLSDPSYGSEEGKKEDNDTSGHTYMRAQHLDWDGSDGIPDDVLEEEEDTPDDTTLDNENQEDLADPVYVNYEFPEGLTSMQAAQIVWEKGIPASEAGRIRMLRALSQRNRFNYPISYDGMTYCEAFERVYPGERLSNLVKDRLRGTMRLTDEINALDASDEEKAFLLFAFPLD